MPTPGPHVIIGTDGADAIHGTSGDDVIYGMGGVSSSPYAGRITAQRVATGFSGAVFAGSAPGQPNRLYVLTKDDGNISILNPANGSSHPFLTIPSDQFSSGGERGVLGLAFDPHYASNGLFYVDLTAPNGDIEIRRYHYSGSGSPTFDRTILTIPHSEFPNHNGGQLAFGPDGYLYIGVGDGGSGFDPHDNGQNTHVLLGKILRIAPTTDPNGTYTIPHSNPFANGIGGAPEVWAYGLRNPWRFSFDSLTGALYIGDVGQNTREEIDFQPHNAHGGRNYGWDNMEGNLVLETPVPPGVVPPIFDYSHAFGDAVIGGVVDRAPGSSLYGDYMFIDFGSSRFWTLKVVNGHAKGVTDRTGQLFSTGAPIDSIATFGQDGHRNVYLASLNGDIFKLEPSAFAGDLADRIHGGLGNDRIYGGPGNDTLYGDRGKDFLSGGLGDDRLFGGPGKDVLDGGPGTNTLSGGAGRDVFLFDTRLGPGNVDVISDFTRGVDSIHLAAARFQGLAKGALPASEFFVGAAPHDAQDRIVYDPTTGALTFEASSGPVLFATLDNHAQISAADFLVI